MSFSVVLFDVDGTLVDSVDSHTRSWQEAFDHFGKHVAFDAIRAQLGKGGDVIVPHFLSPREVAAIGDKLERFRSEIFKRNYMTLVRPFPRVRDLLERLVGDGVKCVLASSAKEAELKHYIEICRIGELIAAQTTYDDIDKSKPSSDVFPAAIAKVGAPPVAKVRVVGDSPWDVVAAHHSSLACISLLCGGFAEADLKRAGATSIFRDPADVLESYQRFRATPELNE